MYSIYRKIVYSMKPLNQKSVWGLSVKRDHNFFYILKNRIYLCFLLLKNTFYMSVLSIQDQLYISRVLSYVCFWIPYLSCLKSSLIVCLICYFWVWSDVVFSLWFLYCSCSLKCPPLFSIFLSFFCVGQGLVWSMINFMVVRGQINGEI